MTHAPEETYAGLALRLLLGDSPKEDLGRVRWEDLLDVAGRNVVLVRLAARLEESGVAAPAFFAEAVERARARNRAVVGMIRRVARACERSGVEFIFAKAFQHYPDMGGDVDLFVSSRSTEVDALILEGTEAAPAKRSLQNRLAGASSYRVAGCAAVLDIHHGRTGPLGEHGSHVHALIRNAARVRVEGAELLAPSAEDLLVLQGMQRVYLHGHIRLCDVASTVSLIRREGFDWDYVVGTSARLGTTYGLRRYLGYAAEIYRRAFDEELILPERARALTLGRRGRIEFRGGFYRFPRVRVAGRVYAGTLRAAVGAGNWEAASRLCLMPLAAAAGALRKLSGPRPAQGSLTNWPRAASR